MERLNKIFADWAKEDKKTELASQKVELGIIDDIASLKKETLKDLANQTKPKAVKKAVSAKDKSQFWLNNKKFAANLEKIANGLMKQQLRRN